MNCANLSCQWVHVHCVSTVTSVCLRFNLRCIWIILAYTLCNQFFIRDYVCCDLLHWWHLFTSCCRGCAYVIINEDIVQLKTRWVFLWSGLGRSEWFGTCHAWTNCLGQAGVHDITRYNIASYEIFNECNSSAFTLSWQPAYTLADYRMPSSIEDVFADKTQQNRLRG